MKKLSYALCLSGILLFTSCGTIFTASKQTITFAGEPGVEIYYHGAKIAKIDDGGTGSTRFRKKLSGETLVAKKEGYKNSPVQLDATFNAVSILNLLNPLAWAIDLATGKCCKWDNTVIEVNMEESTKSN